MKMKQKLLTSGAAIAMTGLLSTGVNAAGALGNATALLVEPLAISETIAMNFGTLAGGSAVGTVVLTTAGTRSRTGDAELIVGGGEAAGSFTITGDPGRAIAVTFSASATLTDGGAANPMVVDNFSDTSAATIPGGGTENFTVGATLNLLANQPAGSYSTTNGGLAAPFTITVNYF